MVIKYRYETLLEWLEDFCLQLECPQPDIQLFGGAYTPEYYKAYGAWETQMLILEKLRYAANKEKEKTKDEQ